MQSVDIGKTSPGAAALSSHRASMPTQAMSGVWPTIRSYIFWQHERGTLHYDIMVTLILIFVFFSPRVIHFDDKPAVHNPHPSDVVVTPDTQGGLVYQISAGAISPGDDALLRSQMLQIIQQISGKVSIVSYEAVNDGKGHVQSYKVVAKRESLTP